MSESVGGIFYEVELETGAMVRKSRQVSQELDGLHAGFTRVAAAVGVFVSSLAVAGVMQRAITSARSYEKALADLSAITGAAGQGLSDLSTEAKQLASTSTASAVQVIEAMKLIASAKADLLETKGALAAVTREAIALAEASGMALPQAAEAVTLALNQFGVGADQAARFVNVLAAGAKFGASEIADTAIALKNSAVSAAAARVSFEETNAALQALAASGIKGGEAGTALRNVLLKLENETDQKLKPSIVGLSGALTALDAKSMSSTQLTKMFGLENVNAAQALIGSAAAVRKLTDQLTGTQTAYEQAAINNNTLDASIKRMNSALDLAAQKLGEQLAPAARATADAIQSLALQFVEGGGAMSTAGAVLETGMVLLAVTITGRVAQALGMFALLLYRAIPVIGAATIAARGFSAALSLMGGPIGVAVTALAVLAMNWDAITGAAKSAAEISEGSATRIAAALAKGGRAATTALQAELAEAKKSLTQLDADIKAGSVKSIYSGKPVDGEERLAELRSQRDKVARVASDIEAAITRAYGGGARPKNEGGGRVAYTGTTAEQDAAAGKGSDDAAGYLAKLRQDVADEYERIGMVEAEALRKNARQEGLTLQQRDEAARLIREKGIRDRAELTQRAIAQTNRDSEEQRKAEDDDYRRREDALQAANDLINAKNAQQIAMEERNEQMRLQRESERSRASMSAKDMALSGDPIAQAREEAARRLQQLDEDLGNQQLLMSEYASARVALEQQTAQKIAEIRQRETDQQAANNQASLALASNLAGDLYSLLERSGKDRNDLGKALFAVSKALAVAEIILNTEVAAAKAGAQLGIFGLPMATMIRATGYASAAMVGGMALGQLAGGRQYGGPVSAGSLYRINETGQPEMFTASNGSQYMMPTRNGSVTPANQVGAAGGAWTVVINNNGAPMRVESQSVDSERRLVTLAVAEAAGQVASHTGPMWQALRNNTNVRSAL